ncbi:hypothetical protein K4L44_06810 [Halosquirtibacter laminarini]|uniref:Uncharacterized protein n=1 Tax=Halosquirtibacter laminarini TaxID=3374600 RepID=A0AC61NQA8_9BACT|nr:hypothetical protein K4L44_06810 [Prolixibacteraceae bacterium]
MNYTAPQLGFVGDDAIYPGLIDNDTSVSFKSIISIRKHDCQGSYIKSLYIGLPQNLQ